MEDNFLRDLMQTYLLSIIKVAIENTRLLFYIDWTIGHINISARQEVGVDYDQYLGMPAISGESGLLSFLCFANSPV